MRTILIFAVLACACAQKPAKLTNEQTQTLLKCKAQLDLLELQYQKAAAPLIAEQNAIAVAACAKAGMKLEECQLDATTGSITRKPQPAKK